MLLVLLIITAVDFVWIIRYALFVCFPHTPRNRYKKKICYIAGIAAFFLAQVAIIIIHNDFITMPLLIIVLCPVVSMAVPRGKDCLTLSGHLHDFVLSDTIWKF